MAQSLTAATIIERLIDMSMGVQDTAARLAQLLSNDRPSPEGLEKFYRQDLLILKDSVSRGKGALLDFIANGRLRVLPYKEFYIDAALQLECVMSRLEAGTYRLLMLLSIDKSPSTEIMANVRGLLKELQSTITSLVDVLRASEAPPVDVLARRKLLDDRFAEATASEDRADKIYREALAKTVTIYRDNPAEMMIFKEVIDSIEDAVDCAYGASTYGRLIGLGSLS